MKPLAILAVLALSTRVLGAEPLSWEEDVDQAIQKAAKEEKPVLVEFSAAWNPWCQALHEKTLPDDSIQDLLGRYIRIRVDAEKHPELMKRFGVKDVPTLVLLDAKGAEIRRVNGFQAIPRMAQELSKGLLGDGTPLPPETEAPRQSDPNNPLPGMAKDMRQAKERLESEDTGRGTMDIQQKLLTQLEELIKQAQQASSSSPSSGGSGKPKPGEGQGQPQHSNDPGKGGAPPEPRRPPTPPATAPPTSSTPWTRRPRSGAACRPRSARRSSRS